MDTHGSMTLRWGLILGFVIGVAAGSGFAETTSTRVFEPSPQAKRISHNRTSEVFFSVPWHTYDDDGTPDDEEDKRILASPDGRFGVYMSNQKDRARYAVLCDLPHQRHSQPLLENSRYFSANWSPNPSVFVVHDLSGPGRSHPHYYRIKELPAGGFVVEHIDLTWIVLKYLAEANGGQEFFKNGIWAVDWSSDAKQVLLYYNCYYPFDEKGMIVSGTKSGLSRIEGYLTCDLETLSLRVGRDTFRSAIPEVDLATGALVSAMRQQAAKFGRKVSTDIPASVIGWRKDRKALVLSVPTYSEEPHEVDDLIVLYDIDKGTVEPVDWIPEGWMTRCNYLKFKPKD